MNYLNNKKAVSANTAPYKFNLNPNYTGKRKFPPYAAQLYQLRCQGKAPAGMVQVVFAWDLARAYTRLVLADDTLPSQLNFSCLAALPVQISYHNRDAHRVDAVAQAIMAVRPSFLCTFNIDLAGGDVPAYTIIQPLQDSSKAKEAA